MTTRLIFLVFFALIGNAMAQTSTPPAQLAPELAPLVGKHRADLATLETQKAAALARAQSNYIATLDFADKSATSAGNLKVVAAVGKEREQAKTRPDLPLNFPADLPEHLRPARRAYMDAIENVNADMKKREQQLYADYLRTLGILQARASGNPVLLQQIGAEKAELLRNATGAAPAGATTPGKPPAPAGAAVVLSGKLVNGNFADIDDKGWPVGWKPLGVDKKTGTFPDGTAVKAIKEKGITPFLRLTSEGRFHGFGMGQDLSVPNRARTAILKFRYRGKVTARMEKSGTWPNASCKFFDENGKGVGEGKWVAGKEADQSSFKSFEHTYSIPSGAVRGEFSFKNGTATGVFDFELAEVKFK